MSHTFWGADFQEENVCFSTFINAQMTSELVIFDKVFNADESQCLTVHVSMLPPQDCCGNCSDSEEEPTRL